jgi:hypothetical protein
MAEVPLITRQALFGNPVRSSGSISPDGRWLGWMAPHEGVMNVFIAPFDDPAAARRMTSAKDRPIPFFSFSRDSRSVIYIQDKAGDENFLLYQVDIASGEERNLTPFENTRVRVIGGSVTIRDKLLVGLNNRNPQYHDVHLLDLHSGELSLVLQNDSYAGFLADDTLRLRRHLRDRRRQGCRNAARQHHARGFARHRPGRLHHRWRDPVLDRQPRPEHRRPHRREHRHRREDRDRRERARRYRRHLAPPGDRGG